MFAFGDPYDLVFDSEGEVDIDVLLDSFLAWGVASTQNGLMRGHDNLHLFSSLDFDEDTIGYAWVGGMCSLAYSGGIEQVYRSTAYDAVTVAHELGHNFYMKHDGDGNACPSTGYIMAPASSETITQLWSTCSVVSANGAFRYFSCLSSDPPSRSWEDGVCGNGVVDLGEDCDCGGVDCSSLNPCCDGSTCQLAADAMCDPFTSACCTDECQPQPLAADIVCRAAVGPCDIEEKCDGSSVECPLDAFVETGSECELDDLSGLCYNGACASAEITCATTISVAQGVPMEACEWREDSLDDVAYCTELLCQPSEPGAFDESCVDCRGTDCRGWEHWLGDGWCDDGTWGMYVIRSRSSKRIYMVVVLCCGFRPVCRVPCALCLVRRFHVLSSALAVSSCLGFLTVTNSTAMRAIVRTVKLRGWRTLAMLPPVALIARVKTVAAAILLMATGPSKASSEMEYVMTVPMVDSTSTVTRLTATMTTAVKLEASVSQRRAAHLCSMTS